MGVSTGRTEGYQANELSDASLNSTGSTPSAFGQTDEHTTDQPLVDAEVVPADEQINDHDQQPQTENNATSNVNRNGESDADNMPGGYGNSSGSGNQDTHQELDYNDDKVREDHVEA